MFSNLGQRFGLTAPAAASSSSLPASEEDDNTPPQFPLPNSIQRAGGSRTKAKPPIPVFSFDTPDSDAEEDADLAYEDGSALPPINIEEDALAAPTSTTKLPKKRAKVSIEKGYSQLDWGRLQKSGTDLRGGVTQLMRVTPEMLAQHKTKDDCWQAYQGKVYNVTAFLKYHPGGVPEMMRAAGKDGTELFMKTHAWVNVDLMLDGCMVGFYVRG